MVADGYSNRLDDLLANAEPLARKPPRELLLTRLLKVEEDVRPRPPSCGAADRSSERGVSARVAAYTTAEPDNETVRFATEQDVDLLLVGASPGLLESGRPSDELAVILEGVPCDVAVLVGTSDMAAGPVVTPFGGVEHDWTAIEIALWLAGALGKTLRLLGTEANSALRRRDASRLLARALLLVQQVVGIVTEPVLVRAGEQ
jgi:hypothetical protein